MPKPADLTPEARDTRDRLAMEAVVTLCPEDAFEATLAVRYVAMNAHAADCLRQASLADNPTDERRSRRLAIAMSRQADAALRILLRVQARREKQFNEMHPATMERAGYRFREISVPEPGPPPSRTEEGEPARTQAQIDADVALYATIYPDRVWRIREAGGLPGDLDFGPPEPEIIAGQLCDAWKDGQGKCAVS